MTIPARRLSRVDRLRKRSEFLSCQSKGRRYFSRQFVIHFLGREEGNRRLGLIVTRETGGAVVRNRWKRVIRDCFRNHAADSLPVGDHVVMVRRSVKGSPKPEDRKELLQLFARVRNG